MKNWQRAISRALAGVLTLAAAMPARAQEQSTAAAETAKGICHWRLETAAAGWRPRDSSGEVVFKDRMWILGGWFDSYSPPPRDVWSSADGVHWEQVTDEAPWRYSDLPMTAVFRDRMWLAGGWTNGRLEGHGATSEVWASNDGREWERVSAGGGWSPRLAGGFVEFKDRLWVLGGTENYYFGDRSSLKNDVWSSADGREWKCETEAAAWPARAYHQAVVHAGRLWVLGGGNYVPEYAARNDVWSSEDGVEWRLETENAPWHPRLWFSAVSWRGCLWVLGGWSNNPHRNHGDVWYSRDGKQWEQLKCGTMWKERHEHSAWIFKDRLWIGAGHAQPLSAEVWSLDLPPHFGEGNVRN